MPRKRLTVTLLARQLQATRRAPHEMRRELAKINEKLDVEPKDAIGFQFVKPDDEDDDLDSE